MRLKICTILIACVFCVTVTAQRLQFVQPKTNNAKVYKNQIREVNENALYEVDREERLKVLDVARRHYKVENSNGKVGWIEKRLVASTSGKTFTFDDAEVMGYLDNPTPIYIMDATDDDARPIQLNRSFAEALKENVDRETVERENE